MISSIPRNEYPRPQFERKEWVNLNGIWTYEFDFGMSGLERGLARAKGFPSSILVPFCPESRLSGVEYTDFINCMFYHRKISIPERWQNKKILLNFGAVDYECRGFLDGKPVGMHYGGTSSFSFDLTEVAEPGKEHDFVLYVFDDVRSGTQANGKQSTSYQSAGCSYTRTTGIWQTVWMEAVDENGLKNCRIVPDFDNRSFVFIPEFYGNASSNTLTVAVSDGKKQVAIRTVRAVSGIPFAVELGDKIKPWEPGSPFLYDIHFSVADNGGKILDDIQSYAGLRKIHTEGGKFYLNNKPLYLRLVLDQGFYPDGVWTAPSDGDLKRDIELALAAGFNGARLHQKVFEERFHYWADKLGYLTWGESASWGYACFSGKADGKSAALWKAQWNFQNEWRDIVSRDANHPSIIAWTPGNETWRTAEETEYVRFMTGIYEQTKMLDPTRPCNDASGYYHVRTDLWTVHFYCKDAEELRRNVFPENAPVSIRDGLETGYSGQPYIVDEIGGFKYIPPDAPIFSANTWGYHNLDIKSSDELCRKIAGQIAFLMSDERISGYCYTQLTDVEQEQNGIYNFNRSEKAPAEQFYAAFARGEFIPLAKCGREPLLTQR